METHRIGEIIINYTSDRRLISKIHKELKQQKVMTHSKNGIRIQTESF